MLHRTVNKSSHTNGISPPSINFHHQDKSPLKSKLSDLHLDDHDEKKAKDQNSRKRRRFILRCLRASMVCSAGFVAMVQFVKVVPSFLNPRIRVVNYANPDGRSVRERYNNTQVIKPEVCFITASYSKDAEEMDKLVVVNNHSPYLRFFLFTNLNDEEWNTPGWSKIVTSFDYKRMITHSRYGKFMGWKHAEVQECKVAFYMDACLRPTQNQTLWRGLAEMIASDESAGLMQSLHPKNRTGVVGEFLAIQNSKKDVPANIVTSLQWMIAQKDLDPKAPIYLNENFGYNPKSPVYQRVSQAFWDHYSMEEDSWRDQPLWAFMLHRYNVTPMPYPPNVYDNLWGRNRGKLLGHNGHEYKSEKDVLA